MTMKSSSLPVANSANYQEFKLKVNAWRLFDGGQQQMSDFVASCCSILRAENKLQSFKHAFVDALLGLDLNVNVLQKLNQNILSESKSCLQSECDVALALNNLDQDSFIAITSFLEIEDILQMQAVDRNLLIQCYDPLVIKHQKLEWHSHRFYFGQNLAHWRFDRVQNMRILSSVDADGMFCGGAINLTTEHIASNINQNWSKSVKTLDFRYNDATAVELQFMDQLPVFQNVENVSLLGFWNDNHEVFLQKKLRHRSLQRLFWSGDIDEYGLDALAKCVNLIEIDMEEAYIDEEHFSAALHLIKCSKLEKLRIDFRGEDPSPRPMPKESSAAFVRHLVMGTDTKLELILTDLGCGVVVDQQMVCKLSSVDIQGPDSRMLDCVESLCRSMGDSEMGHKMDHVSLRFPSMTNDFSDQMAVYLQRLIPHCGAINISFLWTSGALPAVHAIKVLLMRLCGKEMTRNTKATTLTFSLTLQEYQRQKREVLELLSFLEARRNTLDSFCANLIFEIDSYSWEKLESAVNEQWNEDEWKETAKLFQLWHIIKTDRPKRKFH